MRAASCKGVAPAGVKAQSELSTKCVAMSNTDIYTNVRWELLRAAVRLDCPWSTSAFNQHQKPFMATGTFPAAAMHCSHAADFICDTYCAAQAGVASALLLRPAWALLEHGLAQAVQQALHGYWHRWRQQHEDEDMFSPEVQVVCAVSKFVQFDLMPCPAVICNLPVQL